MRSWFMKSRGAKICAAAFIILVSGCSGNSSSNGQRNYPPIEKIENPLTSGYNEMGFRLLRQLNQNAKGRNLLISPLSVSTALALTYNGAQGATQSEIGKALGFKT